jgi:branched-chain amino acid transport system substrate-binding protein
MRICCATLALAMMTSSYATAETTKVGVLAPMSGLNSTFGKQFSEAVAVYQKLHGSEVASNKVEFIFKDLPDINPGQAKALAQELIINDKIHYLAGFEFTPNALAVAPLAQQAKIPTVIFNAATSAITGKSGYMARTSYTLWQVSVPVAKYALDQGVKKVVTVVSDYGPGIDAETAFKKTFEAGGGSVVESIRMPVRTTDFSPILQRAKSFTPEAVYAFLPAGPATFGFVKAFHENGMRDAGIRFLGTAETEETNLQELGDAALGLETGYHYSAVHSSELNGRFVKELKALYPNSVANFTPVGAYDGTHLIYKMIEAAGSRNPDKAMAAIKGLSWESPRGPVRIDPETRDIVQNVYMRVVERGASGKLIKGVQDV